ncbi:hypothetical protein [uncultured Enterococcus sp.]|uniref:hypothetical protein n=1 Tax=uncultured Enterococcus sp. TaxID=167972 RepID=UPI002AA84377|nr:hypothetical protein [uncultured Enterococcus sp.]
MKLKKSETQQKLDAQHQQDQEQLKANAVEIKKLSQTVGKVDVQLIQAHQKIAELEQKLRTNEQLSVNRRRELESTMIYQQDTAPKTEQVPVAPPIQSQPSRPQQPAPTQQQPAAQGVSSCSTATATAVATTVNTDTASECITKAITKRHDLFQGSFLQKQIFCRRPDRYHVSRTLFRYNRIYLLQALKSHRTVTLSIEEMLNRVSDHPKQLSAVTPAGSAQNKATPTSLRRLKKLESDITACFKRVKGGIGSRGMIAKEDVYANIRQIEVIPYLWSMIHTGDNPQDIRLNNEISCQQLVKGVPQFLREVEEVAFQEESNG